MACVHTRTAPSEPLMASLSVDSHPRLPALVTRAKIANRPLDALAHARGQATRS